MSVISRCQSSGWLRGLAIPKKNAKYLADLGAVGGALQLARLAPQGVVDEEPALERLRIVPPDALGVARCPSSGRPYSLPAASSAAA